MNLPPFPTDDSTLDLLEQAINPGPDTPTSSVLDLCRMYSELGGSDTTAVESDDLGVTVMRDPEYHPNDILAALVAEIRTLRSQP